MYAGTVSCRIAAGTSFAFDRIKPESEISPRLSGRLLCVSSIHRSTLGALRRYDPQSCGSPMVAEVHLTLFRNLELGGTRLTEIASRARMTKQAMAELVDKAERLGFVARLPDPDDGRAKTVVFTPAGLWMLDQHRMGVEAAERRMAAVTGAAFVADLRAQLVAYVAGVDAANMEPDRLLVHS